jgi:hypothetical protein
LLVVVVVAPIEVVLVAEVVLNIVLALMFLLG